MTKKIWIALMLSLALAAACLAPMALGQEAQPAEVAQTEPEQTSAPAEEAPAEEPTAEETPAEEPAADAQPSLDLNAMSDDTVLVTLNGQAITRGDIITLYDQMMQQYAAYGMDFSTAENQQALFSYVLNISMQQALMNQKAAELGLDQFTDEETLDMRAGAQANYDSALDMYKGYFAAEGKTDEEIEAEVTSYLEQMGYTVDNLLKDARDSRVFTRVYEYVTRDIDVTDEAVEAAYRQKVEEAKALYEQTPGQFGSDVSGGATVYYAPEGYRTVKHILIQFDQASELKTLYETLADLAEDDPARAETQTQIDALLVDVQPRLDEIRARIEAGDDFQALIDEYGEDGGMQSGTTAETGYYMNRDTTTYVPEFTAGGMALERVGDISEPILTDYGFHIIRYNSDVPSGETPFEQVKDALKTTLTDEAMSAAFAGAMNEWGNASTIEYNILQ